MRKVILNVAVSLDGLIEGPNGEYDWCFTDNDYGMTDFLARTDAIFFGRKSYELYTSSSPDMWTDKKHYVFSETMHLVRRPAVLINGDVKRKVSELKELDGKDIWLFGGAGLTSSFMQLGLIDEMLLAIHPLILGSGKPLFAEGTKKTALRLLESKRYESGLVQNSYELIH